MIILESKFLKDTKLEDNLLFVLKHFTKKLAEDKPSIFISHKHGELDYVFRLQNLLEQFGFTGWVDWQDNSMPKETSGETALKLKEKILKSDKFILLATNAAIESKWCNWEVGFADAHKYIEHIALLPLKKDNGNFVGEEYLQIYPSIQIRINNDNTNYYVLYPNGKEVSLEEWLKK